MNKFYSSMYAFFIALFGFGGSAYYAFEFWQEPTRFMAVITSLWLVIGLFGLIFLAEAMRRGE